MSSRARYPPPGMGGGMNPNHPFQPRNPTQNYTTRGPTPNNMNHQAFHNPQQQQWLRRTQLPPSDSTADEVEKTVQSEAVDSRLGFLLFQIRNMRFWYFNISPLSVQSTKFPQIFFFSFYFQGQSWMPYPIFCICDWINYSKLNKKRGSNSENVISQSSNLCNLKLCACMVGTLP